MSSGPDKVLQELLKQPFGPYLDETVLSKQCKHTSSKRLLLENLMLSYNDKPTGFDRTEFIESFIPSNATHLPAVESGSRVLFRGVHSILALTHLSDKGTKYLNRDFKLRVMGSVSNGIPAAKKYSGFDMKSILELNAERKQPSKARQYEVKVLIQGFMGSTASFMRSDIAPDGLLFHTANTAKTCFRNFEIVSMDIETYKLSRTFLFRFHTLRTMRDIISNYKSGVPTHKRTPQWFLEQYFRGFAYPPQRRWSRINSAEDAESSDEGPTDLDQISNSRPADAQTHRPRHLRIVHKNEVWSILASHSEWIFSLVQSHKDLKNDVHGYSWESFLSKVPQLRKKAVSDEETNRRWGLRDEQEEGCNVRHTRLVVEVPAPIPKPKPISQTTASKKRRCRTKSPPARPPSPKRHHSIPGPSSKALDDTRFDEHLDNIYDSDFSQVSTSSNRSSSNTAALASLHLRDLLPPEMTTPPTLPADMLWHCPVGGGTCSYLIDMCPHGGDNEQVMTMFYELVHAHWEIHLRELDLKYVRRNDVGTFEWIHPKRRQRPWPTTKWEKRRSGIQQYLKQKSPIF